MRTIIRSLIVAVLVSAGTAVAGDLKQVQFQHSGACDDTYHTVPFFTASKRVLIAHGRLINGGIGPQVGFVARQSDGLSFAYSHWPLETMTSQTIRPGDRLVVAPGDGLNFVHWCAPPDSYSWWAIVDYTED